MNPDLRPDRVPRSLFGTPTHQLAILVYRAHPATGPGLCPRCGHGTPCAASRNAEAVIAAAGDDPSRYDRGRQQPTPVVAAPVVAAGGHFGFPVGGRQRRSATRWLERDNQ